MTDLTILVGNDDGFRSSGIDALARHARVLGKVQIIAPEKQQTATSKGLTFQDPIRIHQEETVTGLPVMAYSGFPADSIPIYQHLFSSLPDVVLSGINGGENTSIHSILTSGTCAVAMEAGLKNVPSFALSMDVPEKYFYAKSIPYDLDLAAEIGIKIAKHFLRASPEFWEQVVFVNINFPHDIDESTKIEVVDLDTHKYENYLYEREDPKGEKYFWLWGTRRESFDESKDSYKVLFDNTITITPVVLKSTSSLLKQAQAIMESFEL